MENKICSHIDGSVLASRDGRQEAAQILLAAGTKVSAKAKNGITAMTIALQNGHSETSANP